MPRIKGEVYCTECSMIIPFTKGKHRSKYCSIKCRKAATNNNKKLAKSTRICKECNKILLKTQKYYCSISCTNISKTKTQRIERVKIKCLLCKSTFKCLPKMIPKKKFCSRKCKDLYQKKSYKDDGNPCWNRKSSEKEKQIRSEAMKMKWNDDSIFREKVNKGQNNFRNKTGYWPGSDPVSIAKRENTYFTLTGYRHNWQNPDSREKAQETCLERYGKYSWEIAIENLPSKNTKIEIKIAKILQDNNIEYCQQHRIYFDGRKYKQFDFYLPEYNILIEADGDYWHGNPKFYCDKDLNEIQILNKNNDKFKNDLACDKNLILKRFWECDILEDNFENLFLKEIKTND